jgi:hypothetical protein
MATARRTWQKREGKAAAIFGARRQYGSGSGGREDETCSDSKHPRIFMEQKLRAVHTVLTLWRAVDRAAKKEGKDPVVVLSEKGRHGQWLLIHTDDMPAVIANWLAARDRMEVLDILDRANEYRAGTDEEG